MTGPEPNGLEHELTRRIAYGMPPGEIARQLAHVREGATLEGPRLIIGGTAELPRHVLNGPDRERALELATEHAWRSWFGELRRRNLRPCGWPVEQRTWVTFDAFAGATGGLVEVDENDERAERAERLLISVTCEAVPAT